MRSIPRALVLATPVLAAALLCGPAVLSAQQPAVVNAQLSTQPLNGSLQTTIDSLKQSAAPLWVAYTIPTASAFRNGRDSSEVFYLEHGNSGDDSDQTSAAEHDRAVILFRLASGKIDQLRAESIDRKLDAGGLRFVWLTGVTPEASIATLKQLCLATDSTHLANSAVFLIGLHRSDAATPALVAIAAPGHNLRVREQAAFWLASQRGHEGLAAIQQLLRADKDDDFRAKLVFDLTLSKDPAALPELVRIAHDDASAHVRSQAQFWMASRGGKLVSDSLQQSAGNDPNADNRKKAVFAISRLPNGEATPELVQLAETSKYPEVRKQAVFWLGQSHDPKALDYLTRLVTTSSR